MQVFKVYFKVLKQYIGQCITYLGIYAVVLFCFILPNSVNGQNAFTEQKCKFAIFDYDHSKESESVIKYMSERHKVEQIKNDSKEVMQDELFNRNVDCVIKIKEGFGQHFEAEKMSELSDFLEIITIPNTYTAQLFERDYNRFINYTESYCLSGLDTADAMEKASAAAQSELQVRMIEKKNSSNHNATYYFFNYISWVIVVLFIVTIGYVLLIFQQKDLKKRIACSAYSFAKISREILLGVIVSGLIIVLLFLLLAVIAFKSEILTVQGVMYGLNALCYMFVALAITYLVSQLVKTQNTMNMIGNTVSLGMSFLCGVFVPMEFLSDTVVKIAHFLPAYWYQLTLTNIEKYGTNHINKTLIYMGVQILFALAVAMVGIIASRKNQDKG